MLPNLNPRERALLLLLTVVLLAAGFYFSLFRLQMEVYISARNLLNAKQDRLREAEAVLRSGVNEKEQAGQVKERLDEYISFFDTDFRQGSALLLLSLKATDLDISITNLEPGGILNREHYLELPVKLSLSGSYNSVAQLLGELETLPNLTEIRSLRVTAAANTSGGVSAAGSGPFAGPEDARVDAVCELVIYSSPAPADDLNLEQQIIPAWQTGRDDLFKAPAPVSPHALVPLPPLNQEPEPPEQESGLSSPGPEPAPDGENIQEEPGDDPGPGADEHILN